MRPLVTTTGSLALAALVLAPSASGWSPPRKLDRAAQAPIYAGDSSGRFYALFARPAGADYQLYFDRLGRGGGRGPSERVDEEGAAPAAGDYAIAMAPSGRAVAVWCSAANNSTSPGVFAAVRQPGGRFGPPQELAARVAANGRGDGCETHAAAGADGGLVAAWRRTGSTGNRLEAATIRAGSTTAGAPQLLDDRARGTELPIDLAVDGNGRPTVAWLTRGRIFAARQASAGDAFTVAPATGSACNYGPRPVDVESAAGGASVLLYARCVRGNRHVLRIARAAPGERFRGAQRVARTPHPESRLVMNGGGRLLVTWRGGSGHLFATRGSAGGGIARRPQRLTPRGRMRYRSGIDTHSSAISASGRAIVAWRQRSLRRDASVRIRLSDSRGRFSRRVTAFRAPRSVGVETAMNARGDAAVIWNRPRRGRDRIVAITRMRGRLFELPPNPVARGQVEPTSLLASGRSLLLTWVSQPGLAAVSSVGRFRGR
jgi:hypothetical protein